LLAPENCWYHAASNVIGSQLSGPEVVEQIGERKAFHEFVLSGNEESLEEYYRASGEVRY